MHIMKQPERDCSGSTQSTASGVRMDKKYSCNVSLDLKKIKTIYFTAINFCKKICKTKQIYYSTRCELKRDKTDCKTVTITSLSGA